MPFRTSRILLSLGLLATAWSTLSSAAADEPPPSLNETRLGIIRGTSKGIVLYEPAKTEAPAAAPAGTSNGKVQASADGSLPPAAQEAPAQQTSATAKFLNKLPPPSGRSMADAGRLGAIGGGLPVRTANQATPDTPAQPAVKP